MFATTMVSTLVTMQGLTRATSLPTTSKSCSTSCDLDGDIDIETRGGRSYISVDSSGENDLRVLSKPETVTALQELTRIAVQSQDRRVLPLDPRRRRLSRDT